MDEIKIDDVVNSAIQGYIGLKTLEKLEEYSDFFVFNIVPLIIIFIIILKLR